MLFPTFCENCGCCWWCEVHTSAGRFFFPPPCVCARSCGQKEPPAFFVCTNWGAAPFYFGPPPFQGGCVFLLLGGHRGGVKPPGEAFPQFVRALEIPVPGRQPPGGSEPLSLGTRGKGKPCRGPIEAFSPAPPCLNPGGEECHPIPGDPRREKEPPPAGIPQVRPLPLWIPLH